MKMLKKIWQRLLVSTLLLLGLAAAVEAADVYVMPRNSEGVKGTAYVYRTPRGSFMYLVSSYGDIPQAYDYIKVTVYGEPGEGYYLLEDHGRLIYRINEDKSTTKLFDELSF